MYAEIQAAIASTKALLEIVKATKELRDSSELSAAVAEVNIKLLNVSGVALAGQEKQAALSQRIRELEAEIMKFKDWKAESEQYPLKQIAPGAFVHIYKPLIDIGKPRHWVCANCFRQNQISVLQARRETKAGWPGYMCDACGSEIITGAQPLPIDSAYEC
jgi:hypothetical protein